MQSKKPIKNRVICQNSKKKQKKQLKKNTAQTTSRKICTTQNKSHLETKQNCTKKKNNKKHKHINTHKKKLEIAQTNKTCKNIKYHHEYHLLT